MITFLQIYVYKKYFTDMVKQVMVFDTHNRVRINTVKFPTLSNLHLKNEASKFVLYLELFLSME